MATGTVTWSSLSENTITCSLDSQLVEISIILGGKLVWDWDTLGYL